MDGSRNRLDENNFFSRYGICMQFIVVLLICIIGLTFMMMMDSPGSLQYYIMKQFNVTAYEFSMLYSMGSWPNAFSWLTVYFIDKHFGIGLGSIIFLCVSCFGNILYVIGVFQETYWILVLARLLFGFSGEATSLICNTYILLWFPDKFTNLIFGLAKSIPWLGSALIFQLSNRILQYLMDHQFNEWQAFKMTNTIIMSIIFISLASALLLTLISRPLLQHEKGTTSDLLLIKVQDIFKFPAKFWLLLSTSALVMNSCFNFILMAQNLYIELFSLDINMSDNIISCFSVCTCVITPILTYIVDCFGRNLIFITLSSCLALSAHLLIIFIDLNPFLPTILLSCSLSLMLGSCHSAYSYIVKPQHANSAFTVVQTVTSGCYASGILIVGRIITKYRYVGGEIFYCICLGVALCGCAFLWMLECNDDKSLNPSKRHMDKKEIKNNDNQKLINSVSKLVDSKSQNNYGGMNLPTPSADNCGRKTKS